MSSTPTPAPAADQSLARELRELAAILTNAPHRALVLRAAARIAGA